MYLTLKKKANMHLKEAPAGEQHRSLKALSSNEEVDYRWNTCWLRQNACVKLYMLVVTLTL